MVQEHLLPGAADVRFFHENGFWLAPRVLDDGALERLRAAMDDVYAGRFETGRPPWAGGWQDTGDPTGIRKTDNAHWANLTLRDLALNATIGAMAARLMGTPEVRLWHDQLLYKPGQGPAAAASQAGNVGWHQDHGYWRCTQPDLITAWVAFDDVTTQNGCMLVVPGSHRWGLLPESDFFNTDIETVRARLAARTGHAFEPVPCELPAGAVSFHHCLTVHASGPNLTPRPRRSLVLHLMPEHATYVAGSPDDNHMNAILMRKQGMQHGAAFAGELWPALYRA